MNEGASQWGEVGMGPRGSHVPVLLLPQGLGIARVFVGEIGALAFAAHSESRLGRPRTSSLPRPRGDVWGLLSVSL